MKDEKPEKRGGARTGTGPKPIEASEKKVAVQFYVKQKHVEAAKIKIKLIVNKINSKK